MPPKEGQKAPAECRGFLAPGTSCRPRFDGQTMQLASFQVQELTSGVEYPRSRRAWKPARLWYDKCPRDLYSLPSPSSGS